MQNAAQAQDLAFENLTQAPNMPLQGMGRVRSQVSASSTPLLELRAERIQGLRELADSVIRIQLTTADRLLGQEPSEVFAKPGIFGPDSPEVGSLDQLDHGLDGLEANLREILRLAERLAAL
jgi:hypothetical protein